MAELNKLYDRYKVDPKFNHMRQSDINFVPGSGIIGPTAMLIGEAPGVDENARSTPFVGNAGVKLRKILKEAGIDTSNLFYTNTVKYWPRQPSRSPRAPTDEEIEASREYLVKEIEIVDPDFVALCGRIATQAIFPNIISITKASGKLINKRYLPLMHPAVTLYKPEKYDEVLSGYKMLAALIDSLD